MVHADTTGVLDVVVLGGGGHVGLPLSLALADAGLRVGIFDINEATLQQIGRGEMPFLESGADELLPKVLATGRLELGSSAEMIGRAETVILVIGTPVDEFLGPSMHVFERAVDQIAPTFVRARCGPPDRSTRAPPPTSPRPSRTGEATWTWPSARSE